MTEKLKPKKLMQFTVRMDPDAYEEFRMAAHFNFKSMARITQDLIEAWVSNRKKTDHIMKEWIYANKKPDEKIKRVKRKAGAV